MRQTRRSRSAATPQKDEAANQAEEAKVEDKSVKANLETVFEKESDPKEEVDAAVAEVAEEEPTGEMESEDNVAPAPSEENETETETLASELPAAEEGKEELPAIKSPEAVKSPAAKSPAKPDKPSNDPSKVDATPKKSDIGLIELNCQVCNCSFTNYHEHMNSESHKSKISHPAAKTDNPSTADKAVTTPAQKRSGEQDVTPAAKRMKNQSTPNAPDKFYCEICKLTILKQQDFDHHINGKRHLLNVTRAQGKSYCEICKLFFNTVTDLNDHNESQMHKKNVAERKQDKQVFECTLCAVTSCGQRQYDQHLTSKRHKRLLENPTGANKTTNAVNGKAETKNSESEKKWLYLCNACNFGCNVDQVFNSHMNLADHKAAVIDMKKKGLVREKEGPKSAASKPAPPKPAAASTASTAGTYNARKFPSTNAGPRTNIAASGAMNKPILKSNVNSNSAGPVTTYNIVAGPNVGQGAMSKQAPMKKDGPQGIRKGPVTGPPGLTGPKKNMPPNKPIAAMNKPPLSGRPNPRFQGNVPNNAPNNVPNKFMPNPQPMKLGFQNAGGNFGPAFGTSSHESNHMGGNFGSYRSGNFGMMRNDVNPTPEVRNDFRSSMREDYRNDARDIRDIRDVRTVDMSGDNRGEPSFRAGYYRDMPGETARDVRGEFGGSYRGGDMSLDTRSDMRSGLGADTRGDMRSMTRNDLSRDVGDIRGYSSNDMRDLRNDSRSDYARDRNTMSGYGGSSAFGQSYRGNEEYRSDNYGRGGQTSASTTSAGNYSSGMAASGRYDYMDRSTSAFSNQYSGSSRGMGYMGDLSLNGR